MPDLYEAFGDTFDEMYEKYENAYSIPKKKISARELNYRFTQREGGDWQNLYHEYRHSNTHSSFLDKVNMSNLCQEITLPTDPIQHIDDHSGEIALCILSACECGCSQR